MAHTLEFEDGTTAPPLDEQYVKLVERMVGGLRFPADYLALMRRSNGGIPKSRVFTVGGNDRMVDRVLSFVPDYRTNKNFGWYDVGVVWTQVEDRLGEGVVPFASLFAGDLLCFDFRKNHERPSVVVWDHEQSDTGDPVTRTAAESFEGFVRLLRVANA